MLKLVIPLKSGADVDLFAEMARTLIRIHWQNAAWPEGIHFSCDKETRRLMEDQTRGLPTQVVDAGDVTETSFRGVPIQVEEEKDAPFDLAALARLRRGAGY